MQRKGSQCGGGGGGVNMKCSVLQWHWKTLMYVLDDDKFKCGFGALIGIGLIFCFPSPHTHIMYLVSITLTSLIFLTRQVKLQSEHNRSGFGVVQSGFTID